MVVSLKLGRRTFDMREREALKECIRQLELTHYNVKMELKKANRELAAARLLVAVQKVRDDSRVQTSTSLDQEMTDFVISIVTDREVEILSYEEARMRWLHLNNERKT